MKKLLKKKVNVFGKKLPVFAILLIGMAVIVSAALVPYLSGMVIGAFSVDSPMLAGISLGDETWEGESYPEGQHTLADWETTEAPLVIPGIHGGSSITLYTLSENIGEVEIKGFEEAIVTSEPVDGHEISCDDFESVIVRVDSIYGSLGYGSENDALLICRETGTNEIKFDSQFYGALSTWGAGEADVSKMVVTFKENAVGDYTFTYQVIPEEMP